MAHRRQALLTNAEDGKLIDVTALIDEAFRPMEVSLAQVEVQLELAKQAMREAKLQSIAAMSAVEAAAIAQAEGAAQAVKMAERQAGRTALAEMYVAAQDTSTSSSSKSPNKLRSDSDLAQLSFDDIDYATSEMAPPFLNDDQCLIPGEPVVRVEKAPENSRRIFAGIDIPQSVDEIWNLLTDYRRLSDVVPNLIVNDVLEEYNTDFCQGTTVTYVDSNLPEEVQCQNLANQMKGALLRQGMFWFRIVPWVQTNELRISDQYLSRSFVLFVYCSWWSQGGGAAILGAHYVGSARIPLGTARLRTL